MRRRFCFNNLFLLVWEIKEKRVKYSFNMIIDWKKDHFSEKLLFSLFSNSLTSSLRCFNLSIFFPFHFNLYTAEVLAKEIWGTFRVRTSNEYINFAQNYTKQFHSFLLQYQHKWLKHYINIPMEIHQRIFNFLKQTKCFNVVEDEEENF